MRPEDILNNPLLNKGTAFTDEERSRLGLHGLLPYRVSTLERQAERRYHNFKVQSNDLAKYVFLAGLQNRNEVLFYRLVHDHIEEMLPYIYTPTVGDASIQYSVLYTQHRGVYFSYPLKDKIEEIVANIPQKELDVIVVTDGSRVLGLGDLGAGGMAIPVGKLALYTLFGGISPSRTLPITLDLGTNNSQLLADPLYIGWQHERVTGEEYDAFVEAFVRAIKKRYPGVLLQWEDFETDHARRLLDRYRDEICSFNDDIQGTAAVALSAILSAVKQNHEKLTDQKIVIFGAGSAGLGIARQLVGALMGEGASEREAKSRLFLIDVNGLIHKGHTNILPHQAPFAREEEELASWSVADKGKITLLEVVKNVKPQVLIGVSAQAGAFTEEIVKTMAGSVKRPIIFALSNPTSKAEAHPENLIEWTAGKAIIATGTPFAPVLYEGKHYPASQCNNVYIFPGVGLGLIASKARKATDLMFYKAAEVLSDFSPLVKEGDSSGVPGHIFPSFKDLREISFHIGVAVAQVAIAEGVAGEVPAGPIEEAVRKAMWFPSY